MICRGLMLALERAGHIALPPVRSKPINPLVSRSRPPLIETDTTPITCDLKDLGPLQFRLVRRTPEEPLFNSLIEHHHYLHYTHPVGEQLKYMIFAGERPVACLAWSSAARHLGPRDRFIGWSRQARRRNIRFLAYNSRYLVMPCVRVKFLASHILGRMAALVPRDWQCVYGHPVYYLETFIDPERSRGTCYRAANWIALGLTTGRGKADMSNRPNRSTSASGVCCSNHERRHESARGMTVYTSATMGPFLEQVRASNLTASAKTQAGQLAADAIALSAKVQALEAELAKLQLQRVNETVNQPSGKKPEWDKGNGADPDKPPPKRKLGGRRPGSGNRPKPNPKPDRSIHNPLERCPECQTDLSSVPPAGDVNERIIEDMEPPAEKTVVTEETSDRKWCPSCQKIVSAKSALA